jgi:hypothetical protein
MGWIKKQKAEEEIIEEVVKPIEEKPRVKPQAIETKQTIVVSKLPVQEYKKVKLDDGSVADLMTIEEALTEILNILRN